VILYLDTSSLVKLYVHEPGSEDVGRLLEKAEIAATSVLAYPEARAALARRRRESSLTPTAHRRARAALDADWPRILALDVAEPLAKSAGDLAERHRLRGFDALHLASYLSIGPGVPSRGRTILLRRQGARSGRPAGDATASTASRMIAPRSIETSSSNAWA
jgi:predicted nucleic acid-binding protein